MEFVSLSQLLRCPLFGSNFGLFTVPGFIVSLVGIKKKRRKEEEIKRERTEEGIKQERRKEWKELKDKRNYLKQKSLHL